MRAFLSFLSLCATLTLTSPSPAYAVLATGDTAPTRLGRSIDGGSLSLEDYTNKYVLISFWATWCKPCREELPLLDGFQRKFGNERLAVIAINHREDRQAIRKLLKQFGNLNLTFTTDENGAIGKSYGLKGIPYALLIGPDGKVIEVNVGFDEKRFLALVQKAFDLSRAPENSA